VKLAAPSGDIGIGGRKRVMMWLGLLALLLLLLLWSFVPDISYVTITVCFVYIYN